MQPHDKHLGIIVRFRRTIDEVGDADVDRIWINIHNYGATAANVAFSFDPPLVNSWGTDKGLLSPFLPSAPIVPPGWNQEVKFDDCSRYLDDLFHQRGRIYQFKVTITADDLYSGGPFPAITLPMDLRHLTTKRLEGDLDPAAEFRDERNWQTDPPEESDFVDLQQVLESFTEEELEPVLVGPWDQHVRVALERAGWDMALGKQNTWFRAVATKRLGIHQGASVAASAWSIQATLALALRKALDFDARTVGNPE